MKNKIIPAIIAIALPFTLTACGQQKAEKVESSETTSTSQQQEEASVKEETNTNPKFGETVSYPDGMKLTVKDLGEFTPGEYASGAGEGTPHKLEITIENGTEKNINPSIINVSASSGGKESSQIFDVDNGLDFPPTTAILPGKSVTWIEAYSFLDPNDVTVQVQMIDFNREDVVFTR